MASNKHHPNLLSGLAQQGSDSVKAPGPKNLPTKDERTHSTSFRAGSGRTDEGSKNLNSEKKSSPGKKTLRPTPHAPRPQYVRWLILAAILLVAASTAPAVIALARAGWHAQATKTLAERAVREIQNGDASSAVVTLAEARDNLSDARDALKGVGFWRDVPGVGTQVRALEDAASAGASTVDGMRDLVRVAADLLDAASSVSAATGELVNPVEAHRSFKDLSEEEKRAMLARLDRSLPDIRAAQAKVDVALETWNRIPQNRLFLPLQAAFQPIAENLPRLKRSLDEAVPLIEVFLPMAGYPNPAEYVVVLQNSDEMRATGGFLGTVGVMAVSNGDLERFAFSDVYTLDDPAAKRGWSEPAPAPLRDRLGVPAWFFRDANWSPDFPTSAARMADFYIREVQLGTGVTPKRPDGIIAMNAPFFEGILRITGPITIDGVTFDANNFFDVLEYEVEQAFLNKGIPVNQRKQILLKLGDVLLEKLMSLPARQWPDLLDLATDALNDRDIQIAVRNADVMKRLDAFGWTGRAKPTNGDFVWVIDSNLAALKTDGIMEKRVTYRLDATDPNRPVAEVTLKYTNNGPGIGKDYRYTRYRDYVRVYVPDGAQLLSAEGAMRDDRYRTGGRFVAGPVDVYKELGKTVFGAFWSIEPQTSQELTFRYVLPPENVKYLDNKYRLDIPKQSGNDNVSLTLDLRFAAQVQRATPGESPDQFGDAVYRVESDTSHDREFEVTF